VIDVMEFRQQMINGQETLFGDSWLTATDPTWMADMLQYLYQGSPMRGQQRYISDTVSPMRGQQDYFGDIISPMRGQQSYVGDVTSPMRGQQHYIPKTTSPMRGWELKSLVKMSYHPSYMRGAFASLR
jgi:hypothetical protein